MGRGRPKLSRANEGRSGARWRAARELMFATYGTQCHLCGHDGAGEADHVVPREVWMEEGGHGDDPSNLRPAHGFATRCYVCDPTRGKCCNQSRGNGRHVRVTPVTQPAPTTASNTSRAW